MSDLSLRCSCGELRGVARNVDPGGVFYMACYCDDCQCFANHLGEGGKWLDEHGGSYVLQMTPAQIELEGEAEQLALGRLSPKGTLRWYAKCCNTPVGNTLARPGVPFVGINVHFIEGGDEGLRPLLGGPNKVNGRFAPGPVPADVHPRAPLGIVVRIVGWMISNRLRGRQRPTPFFDASGQPSRPATVLTREQRQALRDALTPA